MDEKLQRIKKWRNGGKAGPYTIEINPTNRCNLACKFCWQRSTEPNLDEEISDDKILKTIDEAVDLGVREVRIPGAGEPMIRKEVVMKMMKRIKEHDVHGLIITNGTFLEEENMEKMVEWDWDNLTVSIDSPDAKTNDYLRGKEGSFEKVKEKLSLLKKIKEDKNSDKPKLRINTVLTNKNYDRLSEMVEFARRFGCEDLQLQPMTPFSDIGKQCMFDGEKEGLNRYLERAVQLAEKYGIYTNMKNFISNEIVERTGDIDNFTEERVGSLQGDFASAPCYQPWYNMVILPNGMTAQCSMFGGKDGVQIKGKELEEVWFGGYFQKTRERILNHDLFSYCENCCVPVNQENEKIRDALKV